MLQGEENSSELGDRLVRFYRLPTPHLAVTLSTLLQESFLLSHELLASLLIPSVYSPSTTHNELSRILFLVFFSPSSCLSRMDSFSEFWNSWSKNIASKFQFQGWDSQPYLQGPLAPTCDHTLGSVTIQDIQLWNHLKFSGEPPLTRCPRFFPTTSLLLSLERALWSSLSFFKSLSSQLHFPSLSSLHPMVCHFASEPLSSSAKSALLDLNLMNSTQSPPVIPTH